MGKTATYESSTLSLKVKVADAKCGLSEVDNAQFDDDWDGMDDAEMNKPYEAPKGKELCAITLTIKNVADDPAEPPYPAGDLTLEDGTTHSRSVEDEIASDTATDSLTEDAYDGPSYDPLNPGDTRDYMYVVSVPKGAKAVSLSYPDENHVLKVTQDPLELLLS
ncbi:hypothetical protein [Brachybacterium sp. NPDC056505]|uniref:hypothetical protein n=1 Tax=Brachybacterium sp. NPDC056505 TaxID=3345843 RepID=UPI00366EE21A